MARSAPTLATAEHRSERGSGVVNLTDPLPLTTPGNELEELDAQMALLADGDRSAIEPLFRALWPVILACCKRALGDLDDANDAAQQAMEKIFTESVRYDRTRRALPWAAAIASWECRTIRRRHQRARTVAVDLVPDVASSDMTPEDAAIVGELLGVAERALGTLSAADREVVRQTFTEEVRERVSVTGATLRKRRERALHRLREAWRKVYGR
jgi:RNA polymerase sigma-70 factor (ECF subfamily)